LPTGRNTGSSKFYEEELSSTVIEGIRQSALLYSSAEPVGAVDGPGENEQTNFLVECIRNYYKRQLSEKQSTQKQVTNHDVYIYMYMYIYK
jgi:hypothetical protein